MTDWQQIVLECRMVQCVSDHTSCWWIITTNMWHLSSATIWKIYRFRLCKLWHWPFNHHIQPVDHMISCTCMNTLHIIRFKHKGIFTSISSTTHRVRRNISYWSLVKMPPWSSCWTSFSAWLTLGLALGVVVVSSIVLLLWS